MDNNNVIVLWSGGHDSTLALVEAIKAGKDDVLALTVQAPELPAGREHAAARERLIPIISAFGEFQHYTVSIDHPGLSITGRIGQTGLWLFAASLFAGASRTKEVHAGYILGDGIWHNIYEVRWAWTAFTRARGGQVPELVTPLEWFSKKDVISALRKHDPRLVEEAWTCEFPTSEGKPCGGCGKCLELAGALGIPECRSDPVADAGQVENENLRWRPQRGGSAWGDADVLRAARRVREHPAFRHVNHGFRPVADTGQLGS